jgi:hypothetical protein
MSAQVPRKERIVVDRGNKFDPFNNHKEDYNRFGLKRIDDNVINYYCSCKKPNCEMDYQRKILGLNIDPPSCFELCNKKTLIIHGTGGDGTYPVCDFVTNWRDPNANENMIFMKRPDAWFNWYYKLPIIFRPSWQNHYHLHHWFGPLHDDPETIVMIKDSTHSKINKLLKPIDDKIIKIQTITIAEPDQYYIYKSAISQLQNEREKIARVNTDPDFWDLINKLHKEASNLTEV